MLAPCSLASLDPIGASLSTLAGSGLRCPKLAGQLFGQWSRPLMEALSADISGPLRSVKSAGDAPLPGEASDACGCQAGSRSGGVTQHIYAGRDAYAVGGNQTIYRRAGE